jgi:hypothetical protein
VQIGATQVSSNAPKFFRFVSKTRHFAPQVFSKNVLVSNRLREYDELNATFSIRGGADMATHSVRQRTLGFNLGRSWPAFFAGALFLGLLVGGGVLIEPEENPVEFAMYLLILAAGFAGLGLARGQSTQS